MAPHAALFTFPLLELSSHATWVALPKSPSLPHVGGHREEGVGGERHPSPKPGHWVVLYGLARSTVKSTWLEHDTRGVRVVSGRGPHRSGLGIALGPPC
jgi:hypothetical protein